MDKEVISTPEEPRVDISEDIFDDSEEVSLLELDQEELAKAMEEAGISIKVDAEGFAVEVQVLSDDVSTFLILSPEEESTGAKVQGFIPRDDGGLSALEMHGQLLEGDVLTDLNGGNARLMEFSDILKACRGPDRGGLPRPLVMRFSRYLGHYIGSVTSAASRPEALSVPTSPAPSSSDAATGKTDAGDCDSAGSGGGGGVAKGDTTGGGSGGSSLLEDLMGGLSLPVFASNPSVDGSQRSQTEPDLSARDGGERHRKIPGMAQIKGVFRAELQGQGVMGGSGGDGNYNGKSENASQNGGGEGTGKSDSAPSSAGVEGLFMNVLRRLESIEVLGEETPTAVAGPTESVPASTSVPPRKAPDNRINGNGHGKRDDNGQGALDSSQPPGAAAGGSAGGVGSSFAGVGAKLRSRLRKPGGFGLHGTPSGGGRGRAGGKDGESGKAFVEGATKALALNRERVMGWMKDLRPKDWSPRAAEHRVEQDVLQDLRRAVRCLYLDAPDPPLHTSMVVARAGASAKAKGFHKESDGVDRVVGTGADKDFLKLVWFRSSSGGGFAEIEGVVGPYYQLSADDVGSRICVKCNLTETAVVAMEVAGVSPTRSGRRGRASPSPSPTRRQAQVAFAEVGPITLDPAVGKEVDTSVMEEPAVFEGLVRRDVPGEKIRVLVEVGLEKVRVLQEPESAPPAKREEAGSNDSSGNAGGAGGEAVVLAEGSYSSGVLVSLDPMRPTALKLTVFLAGQGGGGGGGGDDKKTFLLAAAYGRRRDVLALTLRRRRQAALGPDVVVDDNPEATEAQKENYLELKAAAAHFAKAFDEDNMMTEEEDDDYEEEEEESNSEYSRSSVSSEGDEEEEAVDSYDEGSDIDGVAAQGHGALEGSSREGCVAASHGALVGDGAEQDADEDVPRSLSQVLEELREAREVADIRGRRLAEAHVAWEAAEAGQEKAEAELNLVSSELDLLRPLSRSLTARAEGKEAAEARVVALEAELQELEEQLTASQDEVEKLNSRVGTAEDQAGATAGKLSGLEKVVRRLGEEAEAANKDLSAERAMKEEAMGRASKAERELDQARARAAVLENRLAALEKETLELRADTNASKARAEAIENQLSSARIAEVESLTSRMTELEAQVSSLEGEKHQAIETMKSALSSQADAEARAKEAVATEEQTREQMAEKTEKLVQLTAQRNSAKNRADSLAKDLSRVCGGGRTVDQIEAIFTRYAELKVQMANMKAEQDGATADLHDQWPTGFDGAGKPMAEAVRHTLRQNTELNDRVSTMTETLEMRAQQLEGQRVSNEFLLKRVEDLERQVATINGVPVVGTD